MLVAAFNPDKAQPSQETNTRAPTPLHTPQTLEIEPVATRERGTWADQFTPPLSPQAHGFGDVAGRSPQYLNATLQPPHSPYQINAGMLLPVVLAQDVTSDVLSFFSAVVTRDVYDSVTSRYLLVPAGSRITFLTDLDDRTNQQPILLMAAKTLYLLNGSSMALQGMPAANSFGMTGVQDQVNRHFVQRYGSAAVLSLVVAGIRMATYARSGGGSYYSPEDAAMNGAGSVLGNTVGEDLRRSLSIRPTVVIRAGYPFNVTVTQDMVFPGLYVGHTQLAQQEEDAR
jgi:type IV secretion system protein VirB10